MRSSTMRAALAAAAFGVLPAMALAKCMPATERPLPRPTSQQFMAVLITCDDRLDAMKTYADLSSKYPEALAATALNVDEVNAGAKGVYFRALLGKPGSKKDASGTCTALKAVGYNWCRTMQY
jgi:hypothetical protein